MPKYVAPSYMEKVFTCPYCDVTATQFWYGNSTAKSAQLIKDTTLNAYKLSFSNSFCADREIKDWLFAKCASCKRISVWHKKEMVHPFCSPVAEPNSDMPEEVKAQYIEASKIAFLSPAASAALLRLGLQLLLKDILEKDSTGNIFKDIKLLEQHPIDSNLIKALDIIRISGNESVHPGTLNLNDNKDDVFYLFDLLNMVCDQFYTQPRKMEEMYNKLPKSKRIISE